jgi:hypothetical protein
VGEGFSDLQLHIGVGGFVVPRRTDWSNMEIMKSGWVSVGSRPENMTAVAQSG